MRGFVVILIAAVGLVAPLEAREYRLALITPPEHSWTVAAEAFANALDRATNGRNTVMVYPSQQLGNEAQILQQLQTGAVDMAFITVAEVSNRVPDFGAFYAPYLVSDIAEAARLLRSAEAREMYGQLPSGIGAVAIGYGMAGMRQILIRGQVETMADLRGRKLRITPFAPIRDFYKLIGAAPTPLPLASVYDALANGQVDGIDMDLETILTLKYYDLADSLLLSNHMIFPMIGIVSARVWTRTSVADRHLIRRLMADELDRVLETAIANETRYLAEIQKSGLTVRSAGASFFGPAVEEWDRMWGEKTDAVDRVRRFQKASSTVRGAREQGSP